MNGPYTGMYEVKRLFVPPKTFEENICMYEVANLLDSSQIVLMAEPNSSSNMETNKAFNKLEQRQERIFEQLEQLTSKLQKLKQKITAEPSTTEQPTVTKEITTGKMVLNDITSDVVITVSPAYKPISLMMLCHWLRQKTNVNFTSYIHSSVESAEALKLITKKFSESNNDEQSNNQLRITLIWKEVGKDPLLMVSPTKQGTVSGEVNLLRFFLFNFMQSECCHDPIQATLIDQWLDVTHSSVIHGNNKERQANLRTLNSHLGKAEYLVGDQLSVADVGMLGALLQTVGIEDFPNNVKQWFKRCTHNSWILSGLQIFSINVN